MAMTQFSPALLSLMEVAKKVTPQGQQTVAQRTIEDALATEAPQPSAPPQQGLPGVLAQTQQAAPTVAENMADADALKNAQRLAQAQPKPPAMMAEGGIASLPMGDEEYEYADGGIIGYAGPDGSEVNLGGVSGIAYGSPGESEERERLNRLPLEYLQKLLDAIGAGGKKFVKGTTLESRPKKDEAAVQAGTTYQNPSLDPETGNLRGEPVIAPEGIAAALQQQQRPPAPRPAPSQREGIAQVMPAAEAAMPTFTGAAEEAMGVFKRPDDTRLRAEGERLRELQTQRPTSAAEIRANEIAREKQRAQYEEISGRDTGLGELMSVLGGISRRTGALEGLEGYRTKRDTAAAKETEAARLFAQQQSLLEKKDYADKVGDIKASMEIEGALLKVDEEYKKLMIPASTSAYSTKAQQVSNAAALASREREGAANRAAQLSEGVEGRASAERIAGMRGDVGVNTAERRLYDTINDNAAKQMDEWLKSGANKWAGPAAAAAQRAKFVADQIALAKQMGHKITPEMEAMVKGASATAPGTRENPIKLD